MASSDPNSKLYFYIDIQTDSKKIIGWGIESRETVEVNLTDGYHRVFLSKGQYNKLLKKVATS